MQQLRKERGALWKTWVGQMWAANPGKVFKWIKKLDSDESMAGLHWGEYGAPADIPTRVDKAWKEWTAYWQEGEKPKGMPGCLLGDLTPEDVQEVVRRLSTKKAAGLDHWQPEENCGSCRVRPLNNLRNSTAGANVQESGRRPYVALRWRSSTNPRQSMRVHCAPLGCCPTFIASGWRCVNRSSRHGCLVSMRAGSSRLQRKPGDWEPCKRVNERRGSSLWRPSWIAANAMKEFLCKRRHSRPCAQAAHRGAVALAFNMYAAPRYIRVHGAVAPGFDAASGLVPGCGSAVHFLKAFLLDRPSGEEGVSTRDYVDDLVLTESDVPPGRLQMS